MNEAELKELLQVIDTKLGEIVPLLDKVGQYLVEKARKEEGVELTYSIGWQEAGLDCICLQKGNKNFKTWDQGFHFTQHRIEPLFSDLRYLYFDSPFGLSDSW